MRENQRTLLGQTQTSCEAVCSDLCVLAFLITDISLPTSVSRRRASTSRNVSALLVKCNIIEHPNTQETNWMISPLHSEIPYKSLGDLFITLNMSNAVFGAWCVNIHSRRYCHFPKAPRATWFAGSHSVSQLLGRRHRQSGRHIFISNYHCDTVHVF